MAPSNLQGLNIVHPPSQQPYDSHDLLSGPPYPDLTAQLDLWTNLPFESDETPVSIKADEEKYGKRMGEEEEEDTRNGRETAIHDGHVNVITGINLGSNQSGNEERFQDPSPPFDINTFLADLGVNPFTVSAANTQEPVANAPSLAHLLAIHSSQPNSFQDPLPASSEKAPSTPIESPHYAQPPSKRPRTRKSSISTLDSVQDYREASPNPLSTPLSAAEDKRRRNTAASARFRLKKKEREAALEGRAKELEVRVTELERECEGLRRENGWLKGLVVGVTGAAQQPPVGTVGTISGTKRPRDEPDDA